MAFIWQTNAEFDNWYENEMPYMDSDGTWKKGTKGDDVFEAGNSLSDKMKIWADKMYQTEDKIKEKVLNAGNNIALLAVAGVSIFLYLKFFYKKG